MIYEMKSPYEIHERIFFGFGCSREFAKEIAIWWVNKFSAVHQSLILKNINSKEWELALRGGDLIETKESLYFLFIVDLCVANKNYDGALLVKGYARRIIRERAMSEIWDSNKRTIVTNDLAFLMGMSIIQAEVFLRSPVKDEFIINEVAEWVELANERISLYEQFALALNEQHIEILNRMDLWEKKHT